MIYPHIAMALYQTIDPFWGHRLNILPTENAIWESLIRQFCMDNDKLRWVHRLVCLGRHVQCIYIINSTVRMWNSSNQWFISESDVCNGHQMAPLIYEIVRFRGDILVYWKTISCCHHSLEQYGINTYSVFFKHYKIWLEAFITSFLRFNRPFRLYSTTPYQTESTKSSTRKRLN